MERREINPTDWLGAFNINHGIEVTGAPRVLYLSGQPRTARTGHRSIPATWSPSSGRPGRTSRTR
jgi:hypothetical protein